MAINKKLLERVKQKMAQKQAKKEGRSGGKEGFLNLQDDSAKTDEEGVFINEVRMLPTSLTPEENDPFKKVTMHYGLVPGQPKQGFICLQEQFGKPCPACYMLDPLWNISKEEGAKKGDPAYELAKSFYPVDRYYSPVIRREKGKIVKNSKPEWYGYSEAKQDELFKWFLDERIGDLTDINEGRDLEITKKTGKVVGNQYGTITQQLDPVGQSKLGLSKAKAQELIDQIPDLFKLLEVWDYEKIDETVNAYLQEKVGEEVSETKYGSDDSTDDVDEAFEDLKNQ